MLLFFYLQATMMVYQAVAEYSTTAKEKGTVEYNLNVDVLLPGGPVHSKYQFSRENYHVTRVLKVRFRVRISQMNSAEFYVAVVYVFEECDT